MWFIHFGIFLISIVMPLAIMIIIAQYFIENLDYVDYILYCIGGTLAGIGVTYISVILNIKCNVMLWNNTNLI